MRRLSELALVSQEIPHKRQHGHLIGTEKVLKEVRITTSLALLINAAMRKENFLVPLASQYETGLALQGFVRLSVKREDVTRLSGV